MNNLEFAILATPTVPVKPMVLWQLSIFSWCKGFLALGQTDEGRIYMLVNMLRRTLLRLCTSNIHVYIIYVCMCVLCLSTLDNVFQQFTEFERYSSR